ncbi:NAD(P)-dependent oxidoreductase [Verticiella sediminum]|uniref:NAD(P)-dependent oxidoreductase n=2 Tax=Verticiella sediminum TaxID=1247510 RepID=A0A556AFE2_9BURK|nr:NAD(P)-dependent oxidoreductase [Verticiella sediminum]
MGNPIASHLLANGCEVLVYDRSDAAVAAMTQAGAKALPSVAAVADAAAIVFTSLPSPAVFSDVLLGQGGLAGGKAVKIVVDLSTVGSRATRHAGSVLLEHGIDLVDAPVSGGAAGAKAGTLAVMVAGREAAVAEVQPLLECFGKLFHVGPQAGQAQLLKLLNNMLSSTAFAITAEAFVAGVRGGLDPQVMMSAINAGSGRSGASQDKFMKQVLPRSFDFGFPVGSVCKDIGLAIEECEALGVPMWIGNTVRQLWNFAGRQDGMQRDMTELVRSIEDWSQGAR